MEITVANNAVAIICDGIDIKGSTVKALVNGALVENGFEPWLGIESEIFTYGAKSLILARPARPRLSRSIHGTARLRRKRCR